MPEYERSLTIQASADRIMDFISKIDNLPKYLPITRRAEPEGGERVHVQGEVQGYQYDADGYFKVDKAHYRMEWGSDGKEKYSGWLEVRPLNANSSNVVVHLSFEPPPQLSQNLQKQTGSQDQTIQEDLDAALHSIKNMVEGQGGKVEPESAH